ncbi:MAG: hypothetical protein AB7P99_08000 [Vicinamibacterales bacterium]
MARLRSIHVLLVLALGSLPLAPAEHAHEIAGSDGHQLLVHRHAAGRDGSHAAQPHTHDTLVDHQTAPLLTAAAVFVLPPPPDLQTPVATLTMAGAVPDMAAVRLRAGPPSPVPIHGPPRAPALLRGPPVSPAL